MTPEERQQMHNLTIALGYLSLTVKAMLHSDPSVAAASMDKADEALKKAIDLNNGLVKRLYE